MGLEGHLVALVLDQKFYGFATLWLTRLHLQGL